MMLLARRRVTPRARLRLQGAEQAGWSRGDCTQKRSVVRQQLRKLVRSTVSVANCNSGVLFALVVSKVKHLVQSRSLLGEKKR